MRRAAILNAYDLEAIGERLTRLEREVRLWKRAAAATIVLLVALIAFGLTPRTRRRARPIRLPRTLWSGV